MNIFQWRLPPLIYLLYRLGLAAYTDYWIFETGIEMEKQRQNTTNNTSNMFVLYTFPVYLTNWTYTMLCIYLTLHAVFAIFHYYSKFRTSNMLSAPHAEGHRALFNELSTTPSFWDEDYDRIPDETEDVIAKLYSLPWYFKLTWIFYCIATAASVLVTVMFFAALWPQMDHAGGIDMENLQLHGINSVIVFVDLLLNAIPVRLLHGIYVVIYGVIYVIFTAIFYGAGNHAAIYPGVLDWGMPGRTIGIVLGVAILGVTIIQFLLFCVHKIKLKIYHTITPWSTL